MGLLDNPDALLTLAAGLLGGKKGDTFGTIGQSLMAAQAAAKAEQDRKLREQLMNQQIQTGQISLQEAQQRQRDDALMRSLFSQPQGQAPQGPQSPMGQPESMPGPKGMPPMAANPTNSKKAVAEQYMAMAARLEQSGGSPTNAAALRKAAMDMMPKLKDTKTQVDPQTGQRVSVNFYDDGSVEKVPFAPDQEKAHFADMGGAVVPMDPFTGKPIGQGMGKTVSPDSMLSAQTTVRGQNMTDSRDRAKLAFDTGLNAQQYGFQSPNVPGVNLSGMAPAQAQSVAADVAKKKGEATQTAAFNLPDLEAQTKQTIGLVDKLVSHPGFETSVGAKGFTGALAQAGVPIPGTEAANWKVLRDQVVGQQFMQAYQNLKGAGQITEVEGKKATDAITRMNAAQSEKAFKEAAEEFKQVMQAGVARARSKASGGGWSIRPIQ